MSEERRRPERDNLSIDPTFLTLLRKLTDDELIDEYAYWLDVYARRYDVARSGKRVDRTRPPGLESYYVAAEIERRDVTESLRRLLDRPEDAVRGRVAAILLFRHLDATAEDLLPMLREIAANGNGLAAASADDDLREYDRLVAARDRQPFHENDDALPFTKRVARVTLIPQKRGAL